VKLAVKTETLTIATTTTTRHTSEGRERRPPAELMESAVQTSVHRCTSSHWETQHKS